MKTTRATKRNWKIRLLPFFYRECPMGNAHWRGNHICYCCEGKSHNWTYVWRGDKGWMPHEFVLDTTNKSNSLSFSGQLTTFDLLWNGIRTGLLIAVLLGIVAITIFHFLVESGKNYQKNVQKKYEHVQKSME